MSRLFKILLVLAVVALMSLSAFASPTFLGGDIDVAADEAQSAFAPQHPSLTGGLQAYIDTGPVQGEMVAVYVDDFSYFDSVEASAIIVASKIGAVARGCILTNSLVKHSSYTKPAGTDFQANLANLVDIEVARSGIRVDAAQVCAALISGKCATIQSAKAVPIPKMLVSLVTERATILATGGAKTKTFDCILA